MNRAAMLQKNGGIRADHLKLLWPLGRLSPKPSVTS